MFNPFRNGAAGVFDRHKGGLKLKENLKAGNVAHAQSAVNMAPAQSAKFFEIHKQNSR